LIAAVVIDKIAARVWQLSFLESILIAVTGGAAIGLVARWLIALFRPKKVDQ
jgi:hypothetical protein